MDDIAALMHGFSVAATPVGRARSASFSASDSGSSGTERTLHQTVMNENTAPMTKAVIVTCGIWLSPTASLFMPIHTSTVEKAMATAAAPAVAPAPAEAVPA